MAPKIPQVYKRLLPPRSFSGPLFWTSRFAYTWQLGVHSGCALGVHWGYYISSLHHQKTNMSLSLKYEALSGEKSFVGVYMMNDEIMNKTELSWFTTKNRLMHRSALWVFVVSASEMCFLLDCHSLSEVTHCTSSTNLRVTGQNTKYSRDCAFSF